MVSRTESTVWTATQRLLDLRRRPKWQSLSWITLRPLISAINDRINARAPQLVGDLRRAWVAQQGMQLWRDDSDDSGGSGGVVDRRSDNCFIMLGDTGEQDPSQYVVVPALREAAAEAAFMLIISDVIYPSGDINDYVHGLYLPYGPNPDLDADSPTPAPDPLATLPILALPGNHDWYDGLTGFMSTFCGASELPSASYGWRHGISWGEGIARMLWRRPSRPRSAVLWRRIGPLRPGVARPPHTSPVSLADLRAARVPGGGPWQPLQPGPYYAVQTAHVLLVCIDCGIGDHGETTLDVDQATWLVTVARRPGPKVLLTGNPLLVNAEWKICHLEGAPHGYRQVRSVVEDPANGFVATIGGDIHNFQEYVVEPADGGQLRRHIVSGGGGAYLSATHPVPVAAYQREVRAGRGLRPLPGAGDPGPLPARMYPEPADSLIHFARILLPRLWRFIRVLLTALAGMGGALALWWFDTRRSTGGASGTGGAGAADNAAVQSHLIELTAVLGLFVLGRVALPPEATQSRRYRAVALLFVALLGFEVVLAAWWLDPPAVARNLLGWAALTAAGMVLGWLMRLTGWWREPISSTERTPRSAITASILIWAAGAAWAIALRDGWLIGAAFVLAAVAMLGWRLRGSVALALPVLGATPWSAAAGYLSYATQLSVAVVLVSRLIMAQDSRLLPLAAVAGVVLAVLTAVASVAVVAVVLLVAAYLRGGSTGWRDQWGAVSAFGPRMIGVTLVGCLYWIVHLKAHPGGVAAVHPGWTGVAFGTALLITGTIAGVFFVDLVRRVISGAGYKFVSTGLIGAALAYTAWANQGSWLARAAATALIVAALTLLTLFLVNFAFLGTFALLIDRQARQGGDAPFTRRQAEDIIAWHCGDNARKPADRLVLQRAKIVFPSTDHPQGPIQRKVSELFDSDQPPFTKHFLMVNSTADELVLTPTLVDGSDHPPTLNPPSIRIPLKP